MSCRDPRKPACNAYDWHWLFALHCRSVVLTWSGQPYWRPNRPILPQTVGTLRPHQIFTALHCCSAENKTPKSCWHNKRAAHHAGRGLLIRKNRMKKEAVECLFNCYHFSEVCCPWKSSCFCSFLFDSHEPLEWKIQHLYFLNGKQLVFRCVLLWCSICWISVLWVVYFTFLDICCREKNLMTSLMDCENMVR